MKPKFILAIIGFVPTLLFIPSILKNTTTKYSFVNKIQSNYGMLQQDSQTLISQDLNPESPTTPSLARVDTTQYDNITNDNQSNISELEDKFNKLYNQQKNIDNVDHTAKIKPSTDKSDIQKTPEKQQPIENKNDNDNIESHTEEKLKNATITTSTNKQGAIPKTNKQIENNIEMNQENATIPTSDEQVAIPTSDEQVAIPKTGKKQKKKIKKIDIKYITEFAIEYKKLDQSKRKEYVINEFCKGSLDKTTIKYIFDNKYLDNDILPQFIDIFFDKATLNSILSLYKELNNEKDTDTKNESLWKATLDGKLGSLNTNSFIHQFDKAKDSIPSDQLELLIENNLLNQKTFLEIKKEIEKRDKQNNSNGKNKMEKTKKDKLTKLERELNKIEVKLINNQSNEINNKKQKSRKRKTLSLKDLLTKNDKEIDKEQKPDLLKYIFINHVITGSEIKDLVKDGKIDQTLYNEITSYPEVVKLQDRKRLDLTQKLLLWDCHQFLLTLLSEKFGQLQTTPTKLEITKESDQNSETQLKIEFSLRMRPAPPPISEDEITKLKNMDLEEVKKDVQTELKEYVPKDYMPEKLDMLTTFVVNTYHSLVCGCNQDNKYIPPQNQKEICTISLANFFEICIPMRDFHVLSKTTVTKILSFRDLFNQLLDNILNEILDSIPLPEEIKLEKIKLSDEQFNNFLTSYYVMIKERNLIDSDIIVVEIMILEKAYAIILDYDYNRILRDPNSYTQEEKRNIITFDVRVEIV